MRKLVTPAVLGCPQCLIGLNFHSHGSEAPCTLGDSELIETLSKSGGDVMARSSGLLDEPAHRSMLEKTTAHRFYLSFLQSSSAVFTAAGFLVAPSRHDLPV